MTVNYELGGLILGVCALLPILYRPIRNEVKRIQKERRQLRKLKWSNIPDGRLHECTAVVPYSYEPCPHHGSVSPKFVFNRAWRQPPLHTGKVPFEVPEDGDFICTDARTALAFVLFTCARQSRRGGGIYEGQVEMGTARLRTERKGDVLLVYVGGNFDVRNEDLSKKELNDLLNGYPPWYRETVMAREGFRFPFPLFSQEDVPRAGWIIAVGLSDVEPLVLYTPYHGPGIFRWRQSEDRYRAAIIRCWDHIVQHIQPHFQYDENVEAAIVALDYLITKKTDSALPIRGDFSAIWHDSDGVPLLSRSQCQFLCRNFNQYQPLSNGDKDTMARILLPAMAAAVQGAVQVVSYLKDHGMEMRIPKDLLPMAREMWLQVPA